MSLSDSVVTKGLLALGWLSQKLSRRGRRGLGRYLGWVLELASSKRRAITKENVQHAFPNASATNRDDIVHGAYENLGIVLAEVLAIPALTKTQVAECVAFENIEILRSRVKNRQATILVSAHYGNWEYLALSAGVQLDTAITIVVHPQRNADVAKALNSYRTRFGNKVVSMHDAARTLVRTIRDGGTIAFLVDQHADPSLNPSIEFFGRTTPTYEAPAALALRYNVPIITGFSERLEDGTYAAPLLEIRMDDLENTPAGVRTLTERHVRVLEDVVRKNPAQWSWQHRRWRPEDSQQSSSAT